MSSPDDELRQRPPLWPAILVVAVIAVVLFGLALVFAARNGMPLSSLTRDPVEAAGLRWEAGFLYKISLLVWGATAAACFLGATVWRRLGGADALPGFLLASGAATLVFAIDDTFQLRGEIYDHLGAPDIAVLALYALGLCAVAIVFRSTLRRTEYLVLAAAVALFVVWLVLRRLAAEYAVQDGVRFAGQLALLLYFFRTSAYGLSLRRASG